MPCILVQYINTTGGVGWGVGGEDGREGVITWTYVSEDIYIYCYTKKHFNLFLLFLFYGPSTHFMSFRARSVTLTTPSRFLPTYIGNAPEY